MDVSPWTLNFATRTTGQTDSQGGTDAILLEDDGLGGSSNSVQIFQNVATGTELKNGGQYLLSIDIKAVSGKTSWLFIAAEGYAPTQLSLWCDPNTGSVGTTGADNDFEGVTALTDGWYRFYFAFTLTTDNTGVIRFYLGDSNGDRTIDRDGTHAVLLGRPQLETISGTGLTAPRNFLENDTSAIKSSLSGTSTVGLQLEEARTNIQTYSEDSSFWSETGTSVINSNAAVAPDGSNTATILTDDDGAGYEFARLVQPTISTNTDYAFSMFVKKDAVGAATRVPAFRLTFLGGTGQTFDLQFDTSNGDFDAAIVSGGSGTITGGVIDHSTDYWRFYAIVNDGNTANTSFRCDIFPAITSGTVGGGDSASETGSVTVWGAQLEVGTFPSSYIATKSTSVTRNSDFVFNTSLSGQITQGAFTMYTKFQKNGAFDGNSYIWYFDDGTTTDRAQALTDSGLDLNAFSTSSLGGDVNISPNLALTLDTTIQSALGYAEDDVNHYVDGASVGTASSAGLFGDAITRLFIGEATAASTAPLNGHVAELTYWDERFADSILAEVSLGDFSNTENQVYIRKKARDRFRRRYRRT
jgi:hypothetical protein